MSLAAVNFLPPSYWDNLTLTNTVMDREPSIYTPLYKKTSNETKNAPMETSNPSEHFDQQAWGRRDLSSNPAWGKLV